MKRPKSGIDVFEDAYLGTTKKFIEDFNNEGLLPGLTERVALINSISEEVNGHTALLNRLNQEELPCLAIVPTAIFDTLVQAMNLYTFRTMDSEGRVMADIENYIKKANYQPQTTLLYIFLTSIALAFLILYFSDSPKAYDVIYMLVFSFSVFATRMLLSFDSFIKCQDWLEVIIIPELFFVRFFREKQLSPRNSKKLLWSKRIDTDIPHQVFFDGSIQNSRETNKLLNNNKVRIRLLPAPQNVLDRIAMWKAAGYEPYLVVDERAFEFLFEGTMEAAAQYYMEVPDPIYCLDIGRFTVIIDQYGPFLSEQQIMAFVEKHFRVLTEKTLRHNLN